MNEEAGVVNTVKEQKHGGKKLQGISYGFYAEFQVPFMIG